MISNSKLSIVYTGHQSWSVRLRGACARYAGHYACVASNTQGSAGAEVSVQLSRAPEEHDDVIHHDETVVSGDLSDSDLIQDIVSNYTV